MPFSVVLVNFNGLHLLQNHFASIIDAFRNETHDAEFIVVDNASQDGSVDWLARQYPQVKLLRQDRNCFFPEAANIGIGAARHDLVMLLNEDVHVVSPRLDEIESRFASDPKLFALSPRLDDPRNGRQEKLFCYRHSWGMIDLVEPKKFLSEQEYEIPYGTGGAIFLRRDVFLQIGGFREIYSPFYWDDPDLGLRAWEGGWRIIYFPTSHFNHFHSSIISEHFTQKKIQRTYERNRLLFMHINLNEPVWRLNYLIWLPLRLTKSLLSDRVFLNAWFDYHRLKRNVLTSWRGKRASFLKRFLTSTWN